MIVSNSTPFISLARIGRLNILEAVLGEVLIPNAVYEELVRSGRSGAKDIKNAEWIRLETIPNPAFLKQISNDLGDGEREAIALAKANNTIFTSLSREGTHGILTFRARKEGGYHADSGRTPGTV